MHDLRPTRLKAKKTKIVLQKFIGIETWDLERNQGIQKKSNKLKWVMGDSCSLNLDVDPLHNKFMESICESGQNQLFQFIAWY